MLLHRIRIALFFVAAAVAVGAAQINKSWPPGLQQVPEESPPISPEEALKKFSMPPGYRVELVASEPLIQDPVMIDWDGEGRMWAVEMPGYMPDINAKGEHDADRQDRRARRHEQRRPDGQAHRVSGRPRPGALAEGARSRRARRRAAEPVAVPGHQRRSAGRSQRARHESVRAEGSERRAQREQPAVGARQQHLHIGNRHRPAPEERQVRRAARRCRADSGASRRTMRAGFSGTRTNRRCTSIWFRRTTTCATRICSARAAATNR